VTGVATDKYSFKTPALRNVELSGPYGHAGEFATLRGFVDHYSESDVVLTPQQIDDLTAYLLALTDPHARNLKALTPVNVPSGLTPPGAPVLGVPPIKPLAPRTQVR
jgi:cytochrome c peroxidase